MHNLIFQVKSKNFFILLQSYDYSSLNNTARIFSLHEIFFTFYLSYSICVRPEAGYDCVRWQVRVQNCYINHENQFNAISLIFRFALTSHVGRRLVTVLRYQLLIRHALGTVLERQQIRTNR